MTAALALLMTPAHAGNAETAEGMSAANLYDRDCEKLPPSLMAKIPILLTQIDRDVMLGAIKRVGDYYRSVGTATFCAVWKVKIEKAFETIK